MFFPLAQCGLYFTHTVPSGKGCAVTSNQVPRSNVKVISDQLILSDKIIIWTIYYLSLAPYFTLKVLVCKGCTLSHMEPLWKILVQIQFVLFFTPSAFTITTEGLLDYKECAVLNWLCKMVTISMILVLPGTNCPQGHFCRCLFSLQVSSKSVDIFKIWLR